MHKKCGLTWGYEMPQSLVMADSTTMVLVTNLIAEYSSPSAWISAMAMSLVLAKSFPRSLQICVETALVLLDPSI